MPTRSSRPFNAWLDLPFLFVAFTKTPGGEVVEVCAIRCDPRCPPLTYATLVNPGFGDCDLPGEVLGTETHGLSAADLRHRRELDRHAFQLEILSRGALVVTHEGRWDVWPLEQVGAIGTKLSPAPSVSLRLLARRLLGLGPGDQSSLAAVAAKLDVEHPALVRATDTAETLLTVFMALCEEFAMDPEVDLEREVRRCVAVGAVVPRAVGVW